MRPNVFRKRIAAKVYFVSTTDIPGKPIRSSHDIRYLFRCFNWGSRNWHFLLMFLRGIRLKGVTIPTVAKIGVPTVAKIGGDNSWTRSPWGVPVKQMTKIFWHHFTRPSISYFSGKVGLNLAFRLGYFRYGPYNCMLDTCMLFAKLRIGDPNN